MNGIYKNYDDGQFHVLLKWLEGNLLNELKCVRKKNLTRAHMVIIFLMWILLNKRLGEEN